MTNSSQCRKFIYMYILKQHKKMKGRNNIERKKTKMFCYVKIIFFLYPKQHIIDSFVIQTEAAICS